MLLFEALEMLLEWSELVLESLTLLCATLELLIAAPVLLVEALELWGGGVAVEALELLAGGEGASEEVLELLAASGVELFIEVLEPPPDGAELLTFSLELFAGGLDVADEALLPVEENSPPLPPELSEPLEPPQADSTATELINNSPFIRR